MFTGLIEELARVESVEAKNGALTLSVRRPPAFDDVKEGDSVSVDGICLTVTRPDNSLMHFDVMRESVKKTTLADIKKGDRVNLERALKIGNRLGGHFVTGHIDCKGAIRRYNASANNIKLEISVPEACREFLRPKGSVAVDGISLTVGELDNDGFSVYLIPYTVKNTTLGFKRGGGAVNIEPDILAKYATRHHIDEKGRSKVSMDYLKEHGFA